MNKKILYMSSVLAIIPGLILTPTAFGVNNEESNNNTVKSMQEEPEKKSDKVNNNQKKIIKLLVTDSKGTQYFTYDKTSTIKELLERHNLKLSDYRLSNGDPIKESETLELGNTISIFKAEISGTTEIITLKASVKKVESDELYIGEEEVVEEGNDGEAIKTIIVNRNLAADNKVNANAPENLTSVNSEEKLTIIKAPKTKIINVGTKENLIQTVSPYNNWIKEKSLNDVSNIKTDDAIIKDVIDQIGKQYIYSTEGPNTFDCSGLVYWAFTRAGYSIPRVAKDQGYYSNYVNPDDIKPGDVVWRTDHIGVYVGDGIVVHAADESSGVKTDSLSGFLSSGYQVGRFSK